MTDPLIRCGVVGFGLAGRIFHSAVIRAVDGLALVSIVERTGDSALHAYPDVQIFRSLDEMLGSGDVDLVSIATPNSSHTALARQCLLAGKHVVVDKPLTITSADTAALIALARERDRLLVPYQNRRWDGDFLTVRKLLAAGSLGTLVRFESHFDRFRPAVKANAWREEPAPGSGVLYDLGSHLIDQALVIFGNPAAIFADVRRERTGVQADDAFDLRLYYPEIAVWLRSTCLATLPAPRFLIHGTQASYRKMGLDPQEYALRNGDLFQSEPWGVEPTSSWGTLTREGKTGPIQKAVETEAGDYREFYRSVRDAVLYHQAPAIAPVEAWRTLRVIEMALESSQSRSIVPCDWSEESGLF